MVIRGAGIRRPFVKASAGLAVPLLLFLALSCTSRRTALRLATTTSVDNSGLLQALLPAFESDAGVEVQVLSVGSGKALQLLRRGDAEAALTHDPSAERALLGEGRVGLYRKLMFNDFLIVGPASDPAGVRDSATAVEAMSRIARSGAGFASRGDSSGTHARERALWERAGRRPAPPALLETGQGMAATLRVASERRAYCLVDRATFSQLSPTLDLQPLSEGDGELLNTYAILIAASGDPSRLAAARRLAEWLSDGAGRRGIEAFTIAATHPFSAWPEGRPRDDPDALPR